MFLITLESHQSIVGLYSSMEIYLEAVELVTHQTSTSGHMLVRVRGACSGGPLYGGDIIRYVCT